MFKILFSTFLFFGALNAVAAEVEVNEVLRGATVTGYGEAALSAAKASFADSCRNWQTAVTAELGTSLSYLSCGARTEHPVTEARYVRGRKCFIPGCTPTEGYWTEDTVGYRSSSNAVLRIKADGDITQIHEKISGDSSTDAGTAGFAFLQACRDWKASAKSSIGNSYLYASCEADMGAMNVGSGDLYQYVSRGIIYRK